MPGTPRTFVGAAMFLLDRPVCRHLEAVVTAELERIPGLAVVDLNPRTGSLIVRAGEPVDRTRIVALLERLGCHLRE